MSKNKNIASMYQKELNDLKENIIDSIKFIALENGLGRIEIAYGGIKDYVEFVYEIINNKKVVSNFKVYDGMLKRNPYPTPNGLSIYFLLVILESLEKKDYKVLA